MKNALNFGVYVSGSSIRLRKYLDSYSNHMLIKCVVHDGPESEELPAMLSSANIPYHHVELPQLTGKVASQQLSEFLRAKLDEYEINYCFCFGSRILTGRLMQDYANRIINFHPSLLPAFPGINAVDQALEYGTPLIGNTAHFIDEAVDTGSIIMQSIMPSSDFVNYDSVLDLQLPMLHQIAIWFQENRISVNGRSVLVKDASYSAALFIPALEHEPCLP